jgi:uncharacterized phiE125 gp8 family phage protein
MLNDTVLHRTGIPAEPAVTLAEAKAHLRVDHELEDETIQLYLDAAIDDIGRETSRALAQTTYRLVTPTWYNCRPPGVPRSDYHYPAIVLPIAPVRSVETVKYIDEDGAEQTLAEADWYGNHNNTQGVILFADGVTLPTLYGRNADVIVDFTAGHDPARADATGIDPAYMLPSPLRAAILLQTGHLYANRETVVVGKSANTVPMGAQRLIDQWRIYR